jgi:mRNA interferase MazF
VNNPKAPPAPNRGEIWQLDWSPGRGSEQTGVRPALIVQNDPGNHSPIYPNTIVVSISTKGRNIPFHVFIAHRQTASKSTPMLSASRSRPSARLASSAPPGGG